MVFGKPGADTQKQLLVNEASLQCTISIGWIAKSVVLVDPFRKLCKAELEVSAYFCLQMTLPSALLRVQVIHAAQRCVALCVSRCVLRRGTGYYWRMR